MHHPAVILLPLMLTACGARGSQLASSNARSGAANPLDDIGDVTLVQDGFTFVEGPTWRVAQRDLLFSDIDGNKIYRLLPSGTVEVFRDPSDNTNGMAVDEHGDLLAAEHGARRVSRRDSGGAVATVVDRFEGRKLNSPNDLVVRSDGTVYFTDPPFGIEEGQQELDFNGLFRLAPGVDGALTAEVRGELTWGPNGVALAPGEDILYVTDTTEGTIAAFDVAADGAVSNQRRFADTDATADGVAVDREGNLFVATLAGVEVFAPDGTRWGVIAVPRQPSNCGFGGDDARTLYITARAGLFRVQLARPGIY